MADARLLEGGRDGPDLALGARDLGRDGVQTSSPGALMPSSLVMRMRMRAAIPGPLVSPLPRRPARWQMVRLRVFGKMKGIRAGSDLRAEDLCRQPEHAEHTAECDPCEGGQVGALAATIPASAQATARGRWVRGRLRDGDRDDKGKAHAAQLITVTLPQP
jgi:hypothetical protein